MQVRAPPLGLRGAPLAAAARSKPAAVSSAAPATSGRRSPRPAETGGRWRAGQERRGQDWSPQTWRRSRGERSAACGPGRPPAGALPAGPGAGTQATVRLGAAGELLLLGCWSQMGGGRSRPQVRRGRCNAEREAVELRVPRAARQERSRAPTFRGGRAPAARPRRASRGGKSPRREGWGKAAGGFWTR